MIALYVMKLARMSNLGKSSQSPKHVREPLGGSDYPHVVFPRKSPNPAAQLQFEQGRKYLRRR